MKIKSLRSFKIIAIVLSFLLVFEQSGFAQIAGELDISGHFLALRNSFSQERFRPLHLRYLSYDPAANNFNLLLDKGDQFKQGLSPKDKAPKPIGWFGAPPSAGAVPEEILQQETKTLLNYFFIGISLPNASFWVNLRPDAENNIIDSELAETDVGKILLEADLQLKKDTANFTSPRALEGKDYWDKLYKRAEELYGDENITIPTLTRPWIVPDEIIIRESSDNAYIYKATLKVMLEQDYLKDSSTYSFQDQRSKALNEYSSQLIRETIIPKLTKEINSAKRYAPLRQVYYSLILAQWFKQKFYGKSGLYSYLIDKHKLDGLTSKTPWSKTTYFNAYKTSFQQGEYNIKEPCYTPYGQTIRSYMSGGIAFGEQIPRAFVPIKGNPKMPKPLFIWRQPSIIEMGARKLISGAQALGDIEDLWGLDIKSIGHVSGREDNDYDSLARQDKPALNTTEETANINSGVNSSRDRKIVNDQVSSPIDASEVLLDPKDALRSDGWRKLRLMVSFVRELINSGAEFDDGYYRGLFDNGIFLDEAERIFGERKLIPARIDTYVYNQATSVEQALIELIANAQDAMVNEKRIGRFGVGAYQMFRELKSPEDTVTVITSIDGKLGWRITFKFIEGDLCCKTEQVAEAVQKGTMVAVNTKLTPEEVQERISYIKNKLHTNTRSKITVNEISINNPEQYHYINGDNLVIPDIDPVRVEITENGYTVIDKGIGMSPKTVWEKFLVPKGTTKAIEGKPAEKSSEIREETHLFYSNIISGEGQGRVAVQISGVKNIEVPISGMNIPEELIIELPHDAWLPESRDKIAMDDVTREGLLEVVRKLTSPQRSDIVDRYALINGVASLLRYILKDSEDKSLLYEFRRMCSDYIQTEGFGKIFLPNRKELALLRLSPGQEVIFLDEQMFYFRPNNIPSVEKVRNFVSAANELYIGNLDDLEESNIYIEGSYPDGRGWVILDRRVWEKHGADPAWLNGFLNFSIGYGDEGKNFGTIVKSSVRKVSSGGTDLSVDQSSLGQGIGTKGFKISQEEADALRNDLIFSQLVKKQLDDFEERDVNFIIKIAEEAIAAGEINKGNIDEKIIKLQSWLALLKDLKKSLPEGMFGEAWLQKELYQVKFNIFSSQAIISSPEVRNGKLYFYITRFDDETVHWTAFEINKQGTVTSFEDMRPVFTDQNIYLVGRDKEDSKLYQISIRDGGENKVILEKVVGEYPEGSKNENLIALVQEGEIVSIKIVSRENVAEFCRLPAQNLAGMLAEKPSAVVCNNGYAVWFSRFGHQMIYKVNSSGDVQQIKIKGVDRINTIAIFPNGNIAIAGYKKASFNDDFLNKYSASSSLKADYFSGINREAEIILIDDHGKTDEYYVQDEDIWQKDDGIYFLNDKGLVRLNQNGESEIFALPDLDKIPGSKKIDSLVFTGKYIYLIIAGRDIPLPGANPFYRIEIDKEEAKEITDDSLSRTLITAGEQSYCISLKKGGDRKIRRIEENGEMVIIYNEWDVKAAIPEGNSLFIVREESRLGMHNKLSLYEISQDGKAKFVYSLEGVDLAFWKMENGEFMFLEDYDELTSQEEDVVSLLANPSEPFRALRKVNIYNQRTGEAIKRSAIFFEGSYKNLVFLGQDPFAIESHQISAYPSLSLLIEQKEYLRKNLAVLQERYLPQLFGLLSVLRQNEREQFLQSLVTHKHWMSALIFLSSETILKAGEGIEQLRQILDDVVYKAKNIKQIRETFKFINFILSTIKDEKIALRITGRWCKVFLKNPDLAEVIADKMQEKFDVPQDGFIEMFARKFGIGRNSGGLGTGRNPLEFYQDSKDLAYLPSEVRLYLDFLVSEELMVPVFVSEDRFSGRKTKAEIKGVDLSTLIRLRELSPDIILQHHDVQWEDVVLGVLGLNGSDIQGIRRDIAGAVNSQDKTQQYWIRELAQNARDAIRAMLGIEIKSGFLGHGFYTAFAGGCNEVRIRTGNGTYTYEIVLKPSYDPKGDMVDIAVVRMTRYESNFKGTQIQRVNYYNTTADEDAILGVLYTTRQVKRFLGAIPSRGEDRVSVIYNNELINEDGRRSENAARIIKIENGVTQTPNKDGYYEWIVSIADPVGMDLHTILNKLLPPDVSGKPAQVSPDKEGIGGKLESSFSKDKILRVTVDNLYVDDIDSKYTDLVPQDILQVLLKRGWNINFPQGTPVTRTRIGVMDSQYYRPWIAALALRSAVILYLNEGIPEMEGLIPKDYIYSNSNAIWVSPDILRDAEAINNGIPEKVDFSKYNNPHLLVQLFTMIKVAWKEEHISLWEIKQRVLDEYKKTADKVNLEGILPPGMQGLRDRAESYITQSINKRRVDIGLLMQEPIIIAFQKFVSILNQLIKVNNKNNFVCDIGAPYSARASALVPAEGNITWNLAYYESNLQELYNFISTGLVDRNFLKFIETYIHESSHTVEGNYQAKYKNEWTHQAARNVGGAFGWIMDLLYGRLLSNMGTPEEFREMSKKELEELGFTVEALRESYEKVSNHIKQQTSSLTELALGKAKFSPSAASPLREDRRGSYKSLATARIRDAFQNVLHRDPEDKEVMDVFRFIESDPNGTYLEEGTYSAVARAYANEIKRSAAGSPITAKEQSASSGIVKILDMIKKFIKKAKPEKEASLEYTPFAPSKNNIIQSARKAFAYSDSSQEFSGVDLEYFVHAQNRLAEKLLTDDQLDTALKHFGILKQNNIDDDYRNIIEQLAKGNYTKEGLDIINGQTYDNPRLDVEVTKQNRNARAQGVYEAVANSLDALGFKIGQFGKGVKQILSWLQPTGEDRVDVFTKKKDGKPYRLTILKDKYGQCYIQIKEIDEQEFQGAAQASGEILSNGTIVRVKLKDAIAPTDKQRGDKQFNSQEEIVEGLRKRFAYVPAAEIFVQGEKLNGFETKEVIVPAGGQAGRPGDSRGKRIYVSIDEHTITVIDNGIGMDAEVLSRMFVPKEGTKHPEPLSGEKSVNNEFRNVKVVRDSSLAHRVSFSRNSEVIVAVDIPEGIHSDATVQGGVMVELGALLDVPESRDNIIIPLDLKPGEVSNFQRGVQHAILGIINHQALSNIDKVRYINTIAVGLEGLIKGNTNYEHTIKSIRAYIRNLKEWNDILASLKNEGFVILPHSIQFNKIDLQGKKALFLNEYLFDWRGALNLTEIGGEKIPLITLGGDKNLPLIAVPFTEESLQGARQFNRDWHTWSQDERLPMIKTDRFVAIPMQACGRFLELAKARVKGGNLTSAEEAEFNSILQRINIITAEEVVTSYEITKPKDNVRIISPAEFEKSQGKVDSNAINNFLVKPPIAAQQKVNQSGQVPQDARQRYILLENGNMVELGTGKVVGAHIGHLEILTNGWYKIIGNQGRPDEREQIYKPVYDNGRNDEKEGVWISIDRATDRNEEFVFSPTKRYVFVQDSRDGECNKPAVCDLVTGKTHYLYSDFDEKPSIDKRDSGRLFRRLQFSYDENYLTYVERLSDGEAFFVIVDLLKKEIVKKIAIGENSFDGIEHSLNQFANIALVQSKSGPSPDMFVDLRDGFIYPFKHCHVDSTGTYAVLVNKGWISIYLLKSAKGKRLLTEHNFRSQNIRSVFTGWDANGRIIFGVSENDDGNPFLGVRYFNADGELVDYPSFKATDFNYEVTLPTGRVKLYGRGQALDFGLEKKSAFKHPHFDLFIDDSDPDKPVAVDPLTGKQFPYKGRITHYYRQGPGRPDGMLGYDFEGKNYYVEKGSVNGGLPEIVDGYPARFLIMPIDEGTSRYYSLCFYPNPNSTDAEGGGELEIDPSKYSTAYFDGKYVIFTDPKTGDFIYLDPENPGELAETGRGKTSINNISSERGYVFLDNGNFIDARSGEKIEMDVKKAEYLSHGYYLITKGNDDEFCLNPTLNRRLDDHPQIIQQGDRNEFEFIISPSRRYVTRQHRATGAVGYVMDLESGELYHTNANFSAEPSKIVGPTTRLQFSADEKYVTYYEKVSDEEEYFVIVDLEKKAIAHKFKLEKPISAGYSINPFANVAFLYSKEINLNMVLDLESGECIGGGKISHTDSTGTYTAIIPPLGNGMSVYLHKTKKLLTNKDFKLNRIESVFTGWDAQGKVIFGVSDEGSPFDGVYFDENGQIIDHSKVSFSTVNYYYELFDSQGRNRLIGNETLRLPTLVEKMAKPQQFTQKGLYKHPHFNLFIDESDPDNPVAINPLTGRKFSYQGRIIGSMYSPPAFSSETTETLPEYDYIFVEHEGFVEAREYERESKNSSYKQSRIATKFIPQFRNAVISDTMPYYAVGINNNGTYQFYRMPPGHNLGMPGEPGSFMQEEILISPEDYPYVYFDGNYFVFTNPKTGDIKKLNPKDPKDPLIASFEEIESRPTQNIPNIPEDANQRLFFRNAELVEIGTGKVILDSIQDVEILGNGYYKIITHSQEEIRRLSDTENGYKLEESKFFVHRDEGNVLLSPDKRFAYIQRRDATVGHAVFCLEDGEVYYLESGFSADYAEYAKKAASRFGLKPGYKLQDRTITLVLPPPIFSNLQISSDGRYLTYLETNSANKTRLVVVELNQNRIFLQNAKKSINEIALEGNVDFAINPFSNLVYIKNKDTGGMTLYDLDTGKVVAESAKCLHTDSSGSYTVITGTDGEIVYHNKRVTRLLAHKNGSISTFYLEDGTVKIAVRKSNGEGFWFNDDGTMESFGRKVDLDKKVIAIEQFDFKDNTINFWSGANKLLASGKISESDPLQQLDKEGSLYFDMNSKLIIRSLADGEKVARDPLSSETIAYSGVIVKYVPEIQELIYKDNEGKGKLKASILLRDKRKISETSAVFDDTGNFAIVKNGNEYFMRSGIHVVGDLKGIFSDVYSLVSFDGKYFIFINPTTGHARYQEATRPEKKPIFVSTQGQGKTIVSVEEQNKVVELWNGHIASRRNDFIAQAQSVYQPFLELVPEEYRGEIERKIKDKIENIYREQEKEVLNRFREIAEGKAQELDSDVSLPFDRFQQRMNLFMEHLPGYLRAIANQMAQEDHDDQRDFYINLFGNIFELTLNFELTLEALDKTLISNGGLFEALGLEWGITSQEQLEAIPIISSFINNLKESTNNQIELSEITCIIITLSYFASKDPVKNIPIIERQLERILKLKEKARHETLQKLADAFNSIEDGEEVAPFIDNPSNKADKLGNARPFIIFLTNDVEQVKEKARFIPTGEDKKLPEAGVEISQIVKLEQQRQKTGENEVVISMKELIARLIDRKEKLPSRSETGEAEILKNAKVQRESGAYPAEITQNSRDATMGQKGELVVDYYLQEDGSGKKEYVEEAADNGPGALHEVALIIPKSTKDTGEQLELTGFFGTGKYTIFEGVDRVEIINKNQERAYMFTFNVIKDDSGTPKAIKLTGIRQVTDEGIKQGVTVRRIKRIDNTIPELDQMLSQRAWKVFSSLAQNDNFKIYFINHEGKKTPLVVEKEVLSESDFMAQRPGEERYTSFGKLRIISAKDMPLQIIDKAGLRVCEMKDEYLELIPEALRRHIEELGIIIQIPLPLIRNRSAFENENEYLPIIQKYIAIEFYKAIAYLTLTKTNPQFVFEGFPLDWETNDTYWNSIDLNDLSVVGLVSKINDGEYDKIITKELNNLLTEKGKLDKEKKFVKALLLLKVAIDQGTPDSRISLLLRRLAIQKAIDENMAKRQEEMLRDAGMKIDKVPDVKDVPHYEEKVRQAKTIALAHEQLRRPQDYIIDPSTEEEHKLLELAFAIARNFGMEQALLVNSEARFAGAFISYKNEQGRRVPTMLINQSLTWDNKAPGIQDKSTDTVVHELGHLLEELMRRDTNSLLKEGYVAHMADFTHDAVGTFAEAMKYVSAVSLLGKASSAVIGQEKIVSAGSPVAPAAASSIFKIDFISEDELIRQADNVLFAGQNNFAVSEGPLVTFGLFLCAGLVLYNTKSRLAAVAHFDGDAASPPFLRENLRMILNSMGRGAQNLHARIIGNEVTGGMAGGGNIIAEDLRKELEDFYNIEAEVDLTGEYDFASADNVPRGFMFDPGEGKIRLLRLDAESSRLNLPEKVPGFTKSEKLLSVILSSAGRSSSPVGTKKPGNMGFDMLPEEAAKLIREAARINYEKWLLLPGRLEKAQRVLIKMPGRDSRGGYEFPLGEIATTLPVLIKALLLSGRNIEEIIVQCDSYPELIEALGEDRVKLVTAGRADDELKGIYSPDLVIDFDTAALGEEVPENTVKFPAARLWMSLDRSGEMREILSAAKLTLPKAGEAILKREREKDGQINIFVNPHSDSNKNDNADVWAGLIRELVLEGYKVTLNSGKEGGKDREYTENILEKLKKEVESKDVEDFKGSITELLGVFSKKIDGVITIDSDIFHVAQNLYSLPTVVFTTSNTLGWIPQEKEGLMFKRIKYADSGHPLIATEALRNLLEKGQRARPGFMPDTEIGAGITEEEREVERALSGFIDSGAPQDKVIYAFPGGAHRIMGDDYSYGGINQWWRTNNSKFYDAKDAFLESLPVEFPETYKSGYIIAEGRELAQGIDELFKNAYDAIAAYYYNREPPEGYNGEIRVSLSIQVLAKDEKALVITVTDNGLGEDSASSEQKKKNIFFRGKDNIGLGMAKKIIRDNGGVIDIEIYKKNENSAGPGARVELKIPLKKLVLKTKNTGSAASPLELTPRLSVIEMLPRFKQGGIIEIIDYKGSPEAEEQAGYLSALIDGNAGRHNIPVIRSSIDIADIYDRIPVNTTGGNKDVQWLIYGGKLDNCIMNTMGAVLKGNKKLTVDSITWLTIPLFAVNKSYNMSDRLDAPPVNIEDGGFIDSIIEFSHDGMVTTGDYYYSGEKKSYFEIPVNPGIRIIIRNDGIVAKVLNPQAKQTFILDFYTTVEAMGKYAFKEDSSVSSPVEPDNSYDGFFNRLKDKEEVKLEFSEDTSRKLKTRIVGWMSGFKIRKQEFDLLSAQRQALGEDECRKLNQFISGIAEYAERRRKLFRPQEPLDVAEKILFTTVGYGYPYQEIDIMNLPASVEFYSAKLTKGHDEGSKEMIYKILDRLQGMLEVLSKVAEEGNIDLALAGRTGHEVVVVKKETIQRIYNEVTGASSPLIGDEKGGIDMRSLPQYAKVEQAGNRPAEGISGLAPASHAVLDKEWQEIERMANSGIAPSCERLREYLLSLQDPNSQVDKVLACIADILRQEEEKACCTESSLREILVLLESGKPANELRLALAKIQVLAKEPQLIEQ